MTAGRHTQHVLALPKSNEVDLATAQMHCASSAGHQGPSDMQDTGTLRECLPNDMKDSSSQVDALALLIVMGVTMVMTMAIVAVTMAIGLT